MGYELPLFILVTENRSFFAAGVPEAEMTFLFARFAQQKDASKQASKQALRKW